MAHLKSFQAGARVNECQRLLNEVSAAAACLLDADRKATYDASIRAPANSTVISSPAAPAVAVAARSVRRIRPHSHPIQSVIWIVLGGVFGLFVAVMMLNYFWGIDFFGRAKKSEASAKSEPPKATTVVVPSSHKSPPVLKYEERKPTATTRAALPKPAAIKTPTPPVVQAAPAKTSSAAAEIVRGEPTRNTKDVLEIYNTHNWKYGDRGVKTCNVQLRRGNQVVWKKDSVAVSWDGSKRTNPKTTVELPGVKYDTIRIEVVTCEGASGGLAEIMLLRDGKNIAIGKPTAASAVYNPEHPEHCTPEMLVDGVYDESLPGAGDGKGYWLLPNNKPGWIEVVVDPSNSVNPR